VTQPAMYGRLAPWFHLLTSPVLDDYEEEAEFVLALMRERIDGPLETLLELGSGGGNNALHLKRSLRPTLTDLSPEMLDVSRTINPELEHVVGDMRTLRLGRTFDAVLAHDAICYMTTEPDLRAAFATAFEHLRPGGVAVFAPDHVADTFEPATDHGGNDDPDGRGMRYLEWTTDPDPTDATYRSTTRSCSARRTARSPPSTTGTSRGSSHGRPGSRSSTGSGSRRRP
jgi:SAM-dependent methyltransferase